MASVSRSRSPTPSGGAVALGDVQRPHRVLRRLAGVDGEVAADFAEQSGVRRQCRAGHRPGERQRLAAGDGELTALVADRQDGERGARLGRPGWPSAAGRR